MKPKFRVGTTSYILADNILPNVQYLADKVEDIELVLFEVDDGQNNMLSAEQIAELGQIAAGADLTYTVHLPLDLRMGGQGDQLHQSLVKAKAVIKRTRPLEPFAFVLHLDGKQVDDYERWVDEAARSLTLASDWAGDPALLAVENLEEYPLDFIDPVLERVPVSRCLDIGHLWLEGHDPLAFVEKHLTRARVVHLHGIGTRDHQTLANMSQAQIAAILTALTDFDGVLTLEIFNRADLESSLAVLREAGLEWEPS